MQTLSPRSVREATISHSATIEEGDEESKSLSESAAQMKVDEVLL